MNVALVLAGGIGERVGASIPKQYIRIGGKPIISYCIESLNRHEGIDAIHVVADPKWRGELERLFDESGAGGKLKGFSMPGANRQLSIYQGLRDIRKYADDCDNVFIHDAVRPMLTREMISNCLNAIKGHEGVLPVLPVTDTVYLSEDGKGVSSLINRSRLFAGQAPEVFRLGLYYEANQRLAKEQMLAIHGSAEPAVMAGMDVVMIPGDERNFKITTEEDLRRFRNMIENNTESRRVV